MHGARGSTHCHLAVRAAAKSQRVRAFLAVVTLQSVVTMDSAEATTSSQSRSKLADREERVLPNSGGDGRGQCSQRVRPSDPKSI